MSNMDELLRRALMEANTLDAEEVFAPPGRSAHYQREQLRLCASPFRLARRQAKEYSSGVSTAMSIRAARSSPSIK